MVTIPNTFSAGTTAKSSDVNANFTAIEAGIRPTFVFTVVGTLTTGSSVTPILIVPKSLTITKAYAAVKVAPTGAAILVDINLNGTSIWSSTPANRLTIVAGATSGDEDSFDSTSLAESDQLTMDIDQIGSTVAGSDLTVQIKTS